MRRLLLVAVTLAALAVPGALVLGQDAFKDKVDQTFEKVDSNKDGKLSAEEVKKSYKERQDALDAIYRESIGHDAEKRIQDIYDKYEGVISIREFLMADADDDMVVTREELGQFYERIFTKHAKGPPKLSDKDFETLAAAEIDELWPKLIKFDADKDGKLSKDELIKFAASEMKEAEKNMPRPMVHPSDLPPKEKTPDGK